jgi:hypothetical protein
MKTIQSLIVAAAGFTVLAGATTAHAQIGYYRVTSGYSLPSVPYYAYRPVIQPVTTYSPVVVSQPVVTQPIVTQSVVAPTVVARPVVSAPVVSTPVVAPTVVASPVVVSRPVVAAPVYGGPVVVRRGLFGRPVVVAGYAPAGVVYPAASVYSGVGVTSTYYAPAASVVTPSVYIP